MIDGWTAGPARPRARITIATLMVVNAAVAASMALWITASRHEGPLMSLRLDGRSNAALLQASVIAAVFAVVARRRPGVRGLTARVAGASALLASSYWFRDAWTWAAFVFAPALLGPLVAGGVFAEEMRPGAARDRAIGACRGAASTAATLPLALFVYWSSLVALAMIRG